MIRKTLYIAVVVIGIYLIINLTGTIIRLWQKQEKVRIAQLELDQLTKQNKDLQVKLDYVARPEFIEQEAREKLGLVLPGERQVIIREQSPTTPSSGSSQSKNWWDNWQKWLKLFF